MTASPSPARRLAARLALSDMLFERRIFVFHALGLAAVLAPLILLFAIKFAVVDVMLTRLLDDPRNREIAPIGNQTLESDWLAMLAARPEVAFFVPRTSSLTTQQFCAVADTPAPSESDCLVVPSGPGDPLLGDAPAPEGLTAAATVSLLDRLGLAPGDDLRLRIPRRREGVSENALLTLTIGGRIERSRFDNAALFVSADLLTAIEDFQHGYGSPAFGLDGAPAPLREGHASFRLYVAELDDVAPIAGLLASEGIRTRTRSGDIASVQGLNESLARIFLIIAMLGGLGYALALAATLWAHIDRKRHALSMLQLLGLPRQALALFPIVQALTIALGGAAVATVFAFLAAAAVNASLADGIMPGERVADIRPGHLAVAWVLTVMASIAASLLAAVRTREIEPTEGLRDV